MKSRGKLDNKRKVQFVGLKKSVRLREKTCGTETYGNYIFQFQNSILYKRDREREKIRKQVQKHSSQSVHERLNNSNDSNENSEAVKLRPIKTKVKARIFSFTLLYIRSCLTLKFTNTPC